MRARGAAVALALLLWSAMAAAQDRPAPSEGEPVTTLVADVVEVESENRITATGNVEIFTEGRSLSAAALSYDRATGTVTITGPIVLQDGDNALVFADAAELQDDLREGVMTGARVVLGRQLQIAGAELRRREGGFNELRSVVASSCEVCEEGEAPLWEIRARRVIHDQENARVYFYDARFRILGTPVFYLPVMRMPDGSSDRVTGFLTPSLRTTTQLGPGIKVPYFFALGRSADLTLTPYVATEYTRTMEMRYRQMFWNGEIEFNGALSRDSIMPGDLRGYLFGTGRFDIPRDFTLRFNLQTTSDDPYLSDYDYSNDDRLESNVGLLRARDSELIDAQIVYFQSLRTDEDNDLLPTLAGDAQWTRRFQPGAVGGWLDLELLAHGHRRPSELNIDGRDTAQIRATASWSRIWTAVSGLRLSTDLQLNGDLKYIWQDDRYDSQQAAVTPAAAIRLGWPLAANDPGAAGARYLLEPIAQMVAVGDGVDGPNDDSTLIAYDTGNLLGLNRFPGLDRYEEGVRADLAVRWTRLDSAGWTVATTLGKTYRYRDRDQFPESTGLAGTVSDWMVQADFDYGDWFALRNLLLLDTGFEPTVNESRLSWQGDRLQMGATYVWQRADRALELDDDLSELAADGAFVITDRWSAGFDLRRDLVGQRTNRAEIDLSWANECVRVDFSAVRRFRATEDIEPTTSVGMSVSLAGFGAADMSGSRTKRCTRR